jgi:DNA-binding response OmpR family regulator
MESKVVLVCSDPLARRSTASLLQKAGHPPREASDIGAAIRALNSGEVEAVVVYWSSNDHEFSPICQTMRGLQGFAHIACVVVSEHRSSEDVLTAMEAGADDFVAAPATEAGLNSRIVAAFELTKRRKADTHRARIKHLYINR